MRDIWSFLLQTLTASGAAVLLLIIKAMFRDKLSPRWQFAAWGILALALLAPAGRGGRYALVNWPLFVETLKSAVTGDFSTLTHVTAPVPLPELVRPVSVFNWLFVLYAAGTVFFLARYVFAYIRLRSILRKGKPADCPQLRSAAERYRLPVCKAVEVEGLPSAFVCGVLRPVLALPAGVEMDEKVLLHELLHLKYRDVVWGIVICFFRCVHWCNPLIWYCANQAGNDLEALCDQRVLERLEGEERREYGRILLSMADEKYARAPGTSSMANGGKNIRRRIEAIVRFKKYPKGMALVSVCIALVLTAPLLAGTKAKASFRYSYLKDARLEAAMASARTVWCTTYAGALDTYAKAVLDGNTFYRAMCAPLEEHNALAAGYRQAKWPSADGSSSWENSTLPGWTNTASGYQIYNLVPAGENAYEGLCVVELAHPPEDEAPVDGGSWLAVQTVRAEKQGERWVVLPQEAFWTAHSKWRTLNGHGIDEALAAALIYEAETEDFIVQMRRQTCSHVDSYITNNKWFFSSTSFDTTPQPDGEFSVFSGQELFAIYTGDPADKDRYTHIGASSSPLWEGDERPVLRTPGIADGNGGSTDGDSWAASRLQEDWENQIFLSGGAVGERVPDSYAVNLYLNGSLAAELTLLPVEGDGRDG